MRNNLVVKAFTFLLCWVFALQAQAQAGSEFLRYGVNSVQATGFPAIGSADFERFMGRTLNGSSGSIVADVRLQGTVRGAAAEFTVARSISASSAARMASRALGVVGAGVAIAAIANDVRCRNTGTPLLPIFECDQGTTPTVNPNGQVWIYSGVSPQYPTAAAACMAFYAFSNVGAGFTRWVYVGENAPNGNGDVICRANEMYSDGSVKEANRAHGGVSPSTGQTTACPGGVPPSTLGGVPFCASGTYSPSSDTAVADRVATSPPFTNDRPGAVREAGRVGVQPEGGNTTITGPSTVNLPSTFRSGTGTGGGTFTETSVPWANLTCTGDRCTWTVTTTTTRTDTAPDGQQTTNTTTTTEGGAAQGESITCGLPGTPPCKIDEQGTPTAPADTAQADVDGQTTRARDIASGNTNSLPQWTPINWAFTLPTSCGAIPLPQFAPFMTSIDICPFQATFHDLMGIVWVLGGIFGAIGVFWRDQLQG